MGFDKRLQPLPKTICPSEQPLVLQTIQILDGVCDMVRLVIQDVDLAMVALLQAHDVSWVHAPPYPINLATSLKTGIASLRNKPKDSLVIILPADLPYLQKKSVQTVLSAARKFPNRIVRPTYQGKPGHPLAVPLPTAQDWIKNLHGEQGARDLIESAHTIALDDMGIVHDLDTPKQWNALL